MKVKVEVSDDNQETLRRYSQVIQNSYRDGGISKREREETRSYAVEFLSRFLNENPDLFPHVEEMRKISKEQIGE